jgi:hypothetical protein
MLLLQAFKHCRPYGMSHCNPCASKGHDDVPRCTILVADDASISLCCCYSSCCCCSCTSARISNLEQQVKTLQLSSTSNSKHSKSTGHQTILAVAPAGSSAEALHPAFMSKWQAGGVHDITIAPSTVAFDWQGGIEHPIERLAPYAFHLQHDSGRSLFVLLPCLDQMVEVNYKEGLRLLWVKKQ